MIQKSLRKKILKPLSSLLLTAVLCATLGVQTFIFHAPKAQAAAVSWVGGSTGNWSTTTNWSNSAVPTSSDDVTINRSTGAFVTADSNINFNTLTIGGGSSPNILSLESNIGTGGSITIENNGSLIQKNFVAQTITGSLTINSGGQLQHEENTTAEAYKVDFTAAGIAVNSGATINVNARGYQGDQAFKVGGEGHNGHGTGKGLNLDPYESGSGAGHGGAGGYNGSAGPQQEAGGSAYCTSTNPSTIGSGGGGSGNAPTNGKGGDGGGLVRLTSTGDITIAGSITANGGDGGEDGGNDGGGGSGGGIYIYGNAITANLGTVEAKGGSAGNGNSGGGGGGGCIYYSYTSNAYADFPNSVTGGVGIQNGTAGTYVKSQRAPTIQFDASGYSVSEATSPQTFGLTLSSTSASTVTVRYSLTGTATMGTDYTAPSGIATIAAGSTTTNISIPITNDTIDEADETIILTIYGPENATLGSTTVHTYTILDNDDPPTVQFSGASSSDSEGRTNMIIPVTLSVASGKSVTVDYAVTGGTATGIGTDYTFTSGTLTFAAGSVTQYVPITITDDTIGESGETIITTLSNPSNATLGAQSSHTFTIDDNDGYPSVQFQLTQSEVTEGSIGNIGVALSKAPATGQNVTVNYSVTGGTAVSGTNYTLAAGTLTLTSTSPGYIAPTTIVDGNTTNETIVITLSSPTYATLGVNTIHQVTIKESFEGAPTVTGLTANGATSPVTLSAGNNPVFAWNMTSSSSSSDSQTMYRFTLASSEMNLTTGTYICDSGEVASNRSVIDYASACGYNTLSAGTYYWRVLVKNILGNSSAYSSTQVLIISTPPATPTACVLSSLTASGATLSWTDNATNETGVEIEQSISTFSGMSAISNGNYRRIATTAANAVSYDITGLSPNTTYFYRVRTINNTGYSSYLACTGMTETLAVTPSAPTVTPLSSTSLSVIINENGNSGITEYAINMGAVYLQANGAMAALATYQRKDVWESSFGGITISGLSPNTAYPISIIARNGDSITTSASSTTTAYTLASRAIVSTSSPTTSGFSVSIDAGSNPAAGTLMAIQVYDGTQTRYVQTDGTLGNTVAKQVTGTWGTRTVTGLSSSTNYRIQAIAYNGDANQVPTYSFTAAQYTATDAPTSFRVTALTTSTASLYVDTRSGFMYGFNGVAPTAGNTITASSLTNNGSTVNQTALLNNGANTSTVTMGICTAVETPGALTQDNSARTPTSIKLSLASDVNALSTQYQIIDTRNGLYVSPLGILTSTPTWLLQTDMGGAGGLTIRDLLPGNDYNFRARARNCQNIETELGTQREIELPATAPRAPIVTATSDGNGLSTAQIIIDTTGLSNVPHLEFALYDTTTNQYVDNTSGGSIGNGILLSGISWHTYEDWGGSIGYTINGLPANITHSFVVKARKTINSVSTETGYSPKANLITGAQKSLISTNNTTSSTISLLFNQLSNSSTTEYAIELVPSSGSSTYLTSGGTNSTFGGSQSFASLYAWDGYDGTTNNIITISGLTPSTSYTLRIQPRNSNNVTGYLSPTFTTYTTPATPTGVTVTATSNTHIDVTWNVASNPIGTSYLITSGAYYVVSNALSGTATWSTFANTAPTNTAGIDGLSAGTQYCFTIKSRNANLTESGSTTSTCATTTGTASSSSSSGGGGGGSSSSSSSSSSTTLPADFTNCYDYRDTTRYSSSDCTTARTICNDISSPSFSLASCTALRAAIIGNPNPNPTLAECNLMTSAAYNTAACLAMRTAAGTTSDFTNCYDSSNTTRFASAECTSARATCNDATSATYSSAACTALRAALAAQTQQQATPNPNPTLAECNLMTSAAYNTAACLAMRTAAQATTTPAATTGDFTNCYDSANTTRFASAECTSARATCNDSTSATYSSANCLALRTALASQSQQQATPNPNPTLAECNLMTSSIYNTAACLAMRTAAQATTTPAPVPKTEPVVAKTETSSTAKEPTPASEKKTESVSSSSGNESNNGGSGGGTYVSPEELKKELQEFKKQKEEGLLTFQIGNLKKEIQVDGNSSGGTGTSGGGGVKAETGITREAFLVALVSDIDLEKSYSNSELDKSIFKSKDPIQIADKLEISNAFIENDIGTYDKTKFVTNGEALFAFFIAANVTEQEACTKQIFKVCTINNPNEKLTKAQLTSYLEGLKKYLIAQEVLKTNTNKIDTDKDGITDWKETNIYNTNPAKKDTDGDKLTDGDEINTYKTDPLKPDTDNDNLADNDELIKYKTDPLKSDTDGDNFNDGQEINGFMDEEKKIQKTDALDPLSFPVNKTVKKGTEDTDNDGVCDLCELKAGTDPDSSDSDNDGLIDSADPEPLVFTLKNAPVKVLISNLPNNTKTPSAPFLKGSAPANSMVAIIAKNEFGLKREIAKVQTSENSQFATELRPLPNGDFFLIAQNIDSGESSPQIKVTIDSSLQPEIPKLESIDDLPLTTQDETYIPEVTASPIIKAKLLKGKAVITFKSAIGTSTLISDSSTGELEIRPPEQLTIGDHEVIAYSVEEENNIISPTISYRFKVTEASNAEDFRIRVKDGGGIISFTRDKTVTPIFQKIFLGLAVVIALWLLISLYQFTKRRKK